MVFLCKLYFKSYLLESSEKIWYGTHDSAAFWYFGAPKWYFWSYKKSFLLKSYQQQATNDCTNKLAAIAPQYRLRLHPATTGSNPKHTIYAFFDSYYWNCNEKKTKINKKSPALAQLKKQVRLKGKKYYRLFELTPVRPTANPLKALRS